MNKLQNRLYIVLFFAFGLLKVNAQYNVNVYESVGVCNSFIISDIRNITFANGDLIMMKSNNVSHIFPVSVVRKVDFKDTYTSTIDISSEQENNLLLYPTFVTDYLFMKNIPDANARNLVEIIDLQGKVLITQIYQPQTGINVISLIKGMYICRFSSEGRVENLKFIKQ